jgi:hydrogenase maturation protease
MGDDGAGAAALAWLDAGWALSPAVERLDLGTPGPYLAELLRGYEAVIVLDTVNATGQPGEIRTYRGDDVAPAAAAGPRLTPHAPNLREALDELALEGMRPREFVLLGILPEQVHLGTELSPAVGRALPALVAATVAELEALGHVVPPRKRPLEPDLWWARPVPPVPALV